MKVFISQPMKGKTDVEIAEAKASAIHKVQDYCQRVHGAGVEIINTYFKDYDGNRLQFLGRSISEGLALADLAVFLPGWEKMDGCRCEHFIAAQYGVKTLYINE